MKNLFLSLAIIASISITSCDSKGNSSDSKEALTEQHEAYTASFGVRGNCSMCKETIENAVNAIDGVSFVNWDKDKKKIDLIFEESKTNLDAIHQAIAESGYDTDKVKSNENSYKNLPGCCQYDHSMDMNQK